MAIEGTLNFDNAITAHAKWKLTLSCYIARPDRSLTPTTVEKPDGCELGKWLNGEGQKYSKTPEFSTLVSEHTRFHKAAADVIRQADMGKDVKESITLGSKSEFAAASSAVVNALMHMKSRCN